MRRTLLNSMAIVLATATTALAAGEESGGNWIWMAFLGFGALIVVGQLIPAVMLFGSMVKGIFTAVTEKNTLAPAKKEK